MRAATFFVVLLASSCAAAPAPVKTAVASSPALSRPAPPLERCGSLKKSARDAEESMKSSIEVEITRKVADLAARAKQRAPAAPARLSLRLHNALPDDVRLESIVITIDGETVFASAEPPRAGEKPLVVERPLVLGDHRLMVELGLRHEHMGGIYDYVGHCVGMTDSTSFSLAHTSSSADLYVEVPTGDGEATTRLEGVPRAVQDEIDEE